MQACRVVTICPGRCSSVSRTWRMSARKTWMPGSFKIWRHTGVMLHLRSTHNSPPLLETPGQWRPCLVGTLQEQQERLQRYKRKYYKVRNVYPRDEFGSATSSSDSQESEGAKMRRKQRNKDKRVRRWAPVMRRRGSGWRQRGTRCWPRCRQWKWRAGHQALVCFLWSVTAR